MENSSKIDRSWMFKDRRSEEYANGVEQFINFAMIHARDVKSIRCPCILCGNTRSKSISEIRNHLFFNGIDQSYLKWICHGEELDSEASPIHAQDFFPEDYDTPWCDDAADMVDMVEEAYEQFSADPCIFRKLLEDAEKPLYPGCKKFTKLSALVKMFNFKARNGLSNIGFSELLTMLGGFLPDDHEVPISMYEAKKTMHAVGLDYEKIDACPYDCVLYRKDLKDVTSCPTCETSRWKLKKNSTEVMEGVPVMENKFIVVLMQDIVTKVVFQQRPWELWSLLEFMMPDIFETGDEDLKKLFHSEDRR